MCSRQYTEAGQRRNLGIQWTILLIKLVVDSTTTLLLEGEWPLVHSLLQVHVLTYPHTDFNDSYYSVALHRQEQGSCTFP